jgi:hypothetical protein
MFTSQLGTVLAYLGNIELGASAPVIPPLYAPRIVFTATLDVVVRFDARMV